MDHSRYQGADQAVPAEQVQQSARAWLVKWSGDVGVGGQLPAFTMCSAVPSLPIEDEQEQLLKRQGKWVIGDT